MAEKESNVFKAKLAEQAERYEGKEIVFEAINGHFALLDSSDNYAELASECRLQWANSSFDKSFRILDPPKRLFSIRFALFRASYFRYAHLGLLHSCVVL